MTFATKEEIEEVLTKIKLEVEEQKMVIIVEGAKDKRSLEFLHLKNISVLSGKDLWNRVEQTVQNNQGKEFLILTDFDKKGKELYGKVARSLEKLGVKINKEYREFFQKKTRVSHVEGLAKYVERLEKQKKQIK